MYVTKLTPAVDNGHSRSDNFKSTLKTGNAYAGGRSTNGPVYAEYLASIIGPTANESAALFNYAFSGSSSNNSVTKFDVPDLAQQVSTYLGNLGGSNSTVAATLKNKTLITVWPSRCLCQRRCPHADTQHYRYGGDADCMASGSICKSHGSDVVR